tara:strand:- start:862 stop:2268 length:1407 start_codon:yes stop_codon:yes gene_type:complete
MKFEPKKKIHFIGIGGIGMSAIANVLHKLGFTISGSDLNKNTITEALSKEGIKINYSHSAKNLEHADLVVYSSAIKKNNVEFKFATQNKIQLISRATMLAEVMRLKSSITVAGSHGKTTTTSLISIILETSGMDPTIINGGIINQFNANSKLGKGDWIVAEADESDGSFIFLPSTIAIINNIDLEHLDFYKNIREVKDAFLNYAKNVPFYGFLAVCTDHKNVRNIIKKLVGKKIITFGLSKKCDYHPLNIKTIKVNKKYLSQFDVVLSKQKNRIIKNIRIPIIGMHNIQNVLGSICVSKEIGISNFKIKEALKNFKGVKRRFSIIYDDKNKTVIDDYAHHPEEIKKTLNTLRTITSGKVIVVFEPHRFSRINSLMSDFVKAFKKSDIIYILPVYSAGEKKLKRISNKIISEKLKQKYRAKEILHINNEQQLFLQINQNLQKNDKLIFLGAGTVTKIAKKYCEILNKNF